MAEEWGNHLVLYLYDADGSPIGMQYRNTSYAEGKFDTYWFEKNLQGDIVAIYNDSGVRIGTYTYDAWGNFTVSTATGITSLEHSIVHTYNPFRYRGYYYDVDMGMYYLQSRYYNPQWGRFLNADDISYLGLGHEFNSYNLFAYCGNNPVMGYDPAGTWDWGTFWGGVDLLSVGIAAIAVSATILSCGTAAPVMVAVAAATMTAGIATTVNGAAEVVEAGTGYNVVEEVVFQGDEAAYETYRNATKIVAEIGTAICGTYYAAKGGNVCFIAGTLIATEAGQIPIEQIEPGDMVWATNPETGETALKEVVRLFRNETKEWIHIEVNGEKITCTTEHPFYVPQKGWTSAIDLRAGDILVMLNGEYVVIEQVQHELLESSETTYNFEVEGFHTYHVGNTEVLVHNKCSPQFNDDQQALLELANENRHGVTRSNGDLLVQWANEYGISNHGPMIHSNRSGIWSVLEHIKIKNIHIPIIGG